ncbi:MAG TPA: hypothetical protein VGS19_07915 [Streptosporangiaceae bacterium]|nr:hypothetical protein [Streptosporangiaceae bacterium]
MSAYTTGTTDLVLKGDELFLHKPELRPYFYDGWKVPAGIFDPQAPRMPGEPVLPAEQERNELLVATEYYLDLVETISDNSSNLPADDRVAYLEWIHDMFATSPIMCAYLEKYPLWYPTLTESIGRGECCRGHKLPKVTLPDVAANAPAPPPRGPFRRAAARAARWLVPAAENPAAPAAAPPGTEPPG